MVVIRQKNKFFAKCRPFNLRVFWGEIKIPFRENISLFAGLGEGEGEAPLQEDEHQLPDLATVELVEVEEEQHQPDRRGDVALTGDTLRTNLLCFSANFLYSFLSSVLFEIA